MALAEIIDRILADADAEAARLLAAAAAEARAIEEQGLREAERRLAEIVGGAERELRAEKGSRLAVARLGRRREVLALKHDLLDEVFSEAAALVARSPAGEYAAFLSRLVPAGIVTAPARIAVGGADLERHGPGFAGLVREALSRRHPGWSFEMEPGPAPFGSGITVTGPESVSNLVLDTLFAARRERWDLEVAGVLFAP